jgi:hypothetical protein
METTVVMQNGTSTWFDSAAWNKDPITGGLQPLDIQMGAGELNAKRAQKQFEPGSFEPGFVPMIGWSFTQSPINPGEKNTYAFNRPLKKGRFVSITLALTDKRFSTMTRTVMVSTTLEIHSLNPQSLGAPGRDQLGNLDLYLRDSMGNVIAESVTTQDTIDHIFWQIPEDGRYDFRVQRQNNNAADSAYAVAWWALDGGPAFVLTGDFNFDEEITTDDIAPMLQALTDLEAFKDQWGFDATDLLALADINNSGSVTNADIQGPVLDPSYSCSISPAEQRVLASVKILAPSLRNCHPFEAMRRTAESASTGGDYCERSFFIGSANWTPKRMNSNVKRFDRSIARRSTDHAGVVAASRNHFSTVNGPKMFDWFDRRSPDADNRSDWRIASCHCCSCSFRQSSSHSHCNSYSRCTFRKNCRNCSSLCSSSEPVDDDTPRNPLRTPVRFRRRPWPRSTLSILRSCSLLH